MSEPKPHALWPQRRLRGRGGGAIPEDDLTDKQTDYYHKHTTTEVKDGVTWYNT